MCGDSTNADDVQKLLEGKKFDICITDPPYLKTQLKMDKDGIDLDALACSIKQNMKTNSWIFVYGTLNIAVAFYSKFRIKFEYIWGKPSGTPTLSAIHPMMNHEICWAFIHPELKIMGELCFDKKKLRTEGEPYTDIRTTPAKETEYGRDVSRTAGWRPNIINTGYREGKSILYFNTKNHFRKDDSMFGNLTPHPTQKPQGMYELILRAYCIPNGMLYEPCGGSGTGMAAAEVTGRTCHMMEKSPKYCDIIINRMKNIQTKLETF